MASLIEELIGRDVVLDTPGPIAYLGRLVAIDDGGYWLEDADLHDTRAGHATREQYLAESARDGIRPNRRRIYVQRMAVYSVSALADVIAD